MIWHQREGMIGRYGLNWKWYRTSDGRLRIRLMLKLPLYRRTWLGALSYSTGYGWSTATQVE